MKGLAALARSQEGDLDTERTMDIPAVMIAPG
jgi:hypothetical protein